MPDPDRSIHQADRSKGPCYGCPAAINFGDLFVVRGPQRQRYHWPECDPEPWLAETTVNRAREDYHRLWSILTAVEAIAGIFGPPPVPKGFRR